MTDQTEISPASAKPGMIARFMAIVRTGHLLVRSAMLAVLTVLLVAPLNLIGGVINERQLFQREAEANIVRAWSGPQTFAGPFLVVPYKRIDSTSQFRYTQLPEKLSIEARVEPQQRRRGLFNVTVYNVTMDVVAEFRTQPVRELATELLSIDWNAARLELGVTDSRSIDLSPSDVGGRPLDWAVSDGSALSSHRAPVGPILGGRDNVTVRLRIVLAGSTSLSFVPIGGKTEVNIASPWPSPSFYGNRLPHTQTVSADGFRATWSESALGRKYAQLWDSAGARSNPATTLVMDSAFGVTLLSPVDVYRETDRTIKYAIMFIGLTFAACMLFEMATGRQPHFAQYGLIGLSLCVFYLLLLSLAERIGFLPAYIVSAAAIVLQATFYVWKLQSSRLLGLLFGTILAGLYAGLYGLLQLEEASLLSGSIMLFAVLSLAMWFTRNLHKTA